LKDSLLDARGDLVCGSIPKGISICMSTSRAATLLKLSNRYYHNNIKRGRNNYYIIHEMEYFGCTWVLRYVEEEEKNTIRKTSSFPRFTGIKTSKKSPSSVAQASLTPFQISPSVQHFQLPSPQPPFDGGARRGDGTLG
jgi:hypothetical protein